MAEVLIHHKKSQEKDNGAAPGHAEDSAKKNTVPPATVPSKGKAPINSASAGKAKTSVAARSSAPIPPTSNTVFNKECLSILREMNSNITKNNDKVEKLPQRVDTPYEEEEQYPENENDFQSGYDLYDYDPNDNYDQEAEEDSVSGLVWETV